MKYLRSIVVILIITLASTPALAAHCAASFASNSLMQSLNVDSKTSSMSNCPDHDNQKFKSDSDVDRKSCAMGAGCHFSQATPVEFFSTQTYSASTKQFFTRFTPSEKSIELSPPSKPPA